MSALTKSNFAGFDDSSQVFKLVVMGAGAVGKSAMTIQLVSGTFIGVYDPTIEDAYRLQTQIDGVHALLDILDTAGQEEFSAMRDQYMMLGRGFLLVYAINNRGSFEDLKSFRTRMMRVRDCTPANCPPIVIAGNKCDLEKEREVPTSEGQALADEWGVIFVETSALTKHNLDKAYFDLVREIRKRDNAKNPGNTGPANKQKKGGCLLL